MDGRAVIFDVLGTLFDLTHARDRLTRLGAPDGALEAWFGRMLHTSAALTLVGELHPFGSRAQRVLTVEEVRAYKPHPEPYRHVARTLGRPAESLTLIAAHGWDIVGAHAAGLATVWVDRLERRWPFPTDEPRSARGLVDAVELATAGSA